MTEKDNRVAQKNWGKDRFFYSLLIVPGPAMVERTTGFRYLDVDDFRFDAFTLGGNLHVFAILFGPVECAFRHGVRPFMRPAYKFNSATIGRSIIQRNPAA